MITILALLEVSHIINFLYSRLLGHEHFKLSYCLMSSFINSNILPFFFPVLPEY